MAGVRESNIRTRRRRKSFKIPTPVIYIFLVTVGLYFFLHSPVFNIKNINVTGNNFLATEKIISLSQLNTGQNIMKIEKDEIIKSISVHTLLNRSV